MKQHKYDPGLDDKGRPIAHLWCPKIIRGKDTEMKTLHRKILGILCMTPIGIILLGALASGSWCCYTIVASFSRSTITALIIVFGFCCVIAVARYLAIFGLKLWEKE